MEQEANAMKRALFAFVIAVTVHNPLMGQEANEPVYTETILQPIRYKELSYPLFARITGVHGAVVVKAKLDNAGNVLSAVAIAGPRMLIGPALENIKGWQFQPNAENPYDVVVLIYDFRLEGYCVSEGRCDSLFTFRPRNIATITAGRMLIDHAPTW
jgi:hypothetical protein